MYGFPPAQLNHKFITHNNKISNSIMFDKYTGGKNLWGNCDCELSEIHPARTPEREKWKIEREVSDRRELRAVFCKMCQRVS